VAKKAKKKTVVRREYTKADVELRAHSKAKTPVVKIAKLTKRSHSDRASRARIATDKPARSVNLLYACE
jgi:hypothetical protein